jgi:hypothetical protein
MRVGYSIIGKTVMNDYSDMQRLLIEQAAYYGGRDSEADRIAELEAENARLRKALAIAANRLDATANCIDGPGLAHIVRVRADEARAALAADPTKQGQP